MNKLADGYPHATVLDGGEATVARVLDAIDGSSLAHVAAHGAVRADNPLFSHLRMADGPMTVHDVARLRHAPHRLVLPSCESAALTPTGSDELLGLAAALLPRGTAALVATADPVNDGATGALMLALHDALRAGATSLAQALLAARRAMPCDPVSRATAASFIAIGAG
jgi:CHAT domain-containing protein